MRRNAITAFVVLLLVGAFASSLFAAANPTIYIHNKPYKGDREFERGKLYLPIAEYAAALGLHVHDNGKAWCLTDASHGDKVCPLNARAEGLYVNGVAVNNALQMIKGQPYIAAEATTRALGGIYLNNASLGMIDISVKYVAPPQAVGPHPTGDVAIAGGSKVLMVHWFATW